MTQWVNMPDAQTWQPEFDPQHPHDGKREPTPSGCPLVSTHTHPDSSK